MPGEKNLIDKRGKCGHYPQTLQDSFTLVFSGGDCVTGPDIAISAISGGQGGGGID